MFARVLTEKNSVRVFRESPNNREVDRISLSAVVYCVESSDRSVVCGSGPGRTRPHNRRYMWHLGQKQPQLGQTATVE